LLNQVLEPDCILLGGLVIGPARREPFVNPLARGRIGNGSNIGRDLGGLFTHRRGTEHNRQTTIEPVVHPEIESQACQQTGGHGHHRPK
jgi:hypothetical protein